MFVPFGPFDAGRTREDEAGHDGQDDGQKEWLQNESLAGSHRQEIEGLKAIEGQARVWKKKGGNFLVF